MEHFLKKFNIALQLNMTFLAVIVNSPRKSYLGHCSEFGTFGGGGGML